MILYEANLIPLDDTHAPIDLVFFSKVSCMNYLQRQEAEHTAAGVAFVAGHTEYLVPSEFAADRAWSDSPAAILAHWQEQIFPASPRHAFVPHL